MSFPLWQRWGPLTGLLAVALWVIAFAVASGTPDSGGSDAKIVDYFAKDSHQTRQIVAFLIFFVGSMFFVAFVAALRERLLLAEGTPGRITALAYGAGIATPVFFTAATALFTSPAFAADDTNKFHLDADTYRILNDLGYELWVAAVMIGALLVWATSAIALRSALLPRWFGWVGIAAGLLQLFAIFFLPVFVYWGWIVVASALLTWRRPVPVATTGAVPAP
jgi:hypothetical protein